MFLKYSVLFICVPLSVFFILFLVLYAFQPVFIPLSSPILRMQFLRGERLLGDKNKSRFSRAHVAYEKSGMRL